LRFRDTALEFVVEGNPLPLLAEMSWGILSEAARAAGAVMVTVKAAAMALAARRLSIMLRMPHSRTSRVPWNFGGGPVVVTLR
jgi:hypothetical protein